jgi:uncharacterized protein YxeA
MHLQWLLILMFICSFGQINAQFTLSGKITDENNIAVPFATVYVKLAQDQRTKSNENGEYTMQLFEGEYYIVFKADGYEEREAYISVTNKDQVRDVQLFELKIKDIDEVQVKAKKANVGREIMLKVVERKETMDLWNYPHSCNVYIKAKEKIDRPAKKEKTTEESTDLAINTTKTLENNDMSLCEVQIQRNYAPPNKVKEIRTAYSLRGTLENLYYTTTVKSNFNFFDNLLYLDDLNESPVQSPISVAGILSYKYKLISKYVENGKSIFKIKITARSTATSTLEGFVYVIDSSFLIQKLDLTLNKGNLLRFDKFNIQQDFEQISDSLCVLKTQLLTYSVKFKSGTSNCTTQADFSNYDFGPNFSKKYFTREVAVTTQEAYDRDSNYWNTARKIALTEDEKRFIKSKDSLKDALNRTDYLDSIDRVFNKITPLKVLWFGVEKRDRAKGVQWNYGSLAQMIRPVYIAGPRIAPGVSYFKKWKKTQKTFDGQLSLTYGFLNKDVKGTGYIRYNYNTFKLAKVYFYVNHDFNVIRSNDAITQIFKRDNFIEATSMNLNHTFEVFNGFYLTNNIEFTERRNVRNLKYITWFDKDLNNNKPTDFKSYQALILEGKIEYVPGQKYMREPNRKVVLGSKWPTFSLSYQKGVYGVFGSDVNHDYAKIAIEQTFKILTFGTSSYTMSSGKFLNTKKLFDADKKYHRRSDPFWFASPLTTFQNLSSTLPTVGVFYEGHFVHHDNGAILNKIPFMKKTRIGLVIGTSLLYIPEYDFFHYEAYLGLERSFKLSRRRLRIGLYGVMSDGNKTNYNSALKISFGILDDTNMKYSF